MRSRSVIILTSVAGALAIGELGSSVIIAVENYRHSMPVFAVVLAVFFPGAIGSERHCPGVGPRPEPSDSLRSRPRSASPYRRRSHDAGGRHVTGPSAILKSAGTSDRVDLRRAPACLGNGSTG
jgi:hypothetical protein